jgi:hypothetical protein
VRSKSWECHRRKGGCTWTLRTVDTLVEALTHPHGVGTLERRIPLNVPLAPRAVPAAPPKPPRPTPAQSTSAVAEAVGSLACPRWPGGGGLPPLSPRRVNRSGNSPPVIRRRGKLLTVNDAPVHDDACVAVAVRLKVSFRPA